jgi:hypothetical protein
MTARSSYQLASTPSRSPGGKFTPSHENVLVSKKKRSFIGGSKYMTAIVAIEPDLVYDVRLGDEVRTPNTRLQPSQQNDVQGISKNERGSAA